jgi:hypothetical protein
MKIKEFITFILENRQAKANIRENPRLLKGGMKK